MLYCFFDGCGKFKGISFINNFQNNNMFNPIKYKIDIIKYLNEENTNPFIETDLFNDESKLFGNKFGIFGGKSVFPTNTVNANNSIYKSV